MTKVHKKDKNKPGLIGMDLLRLGLERANSAKHAITIIGDLI